MNVKNNKIGQSLNELTEKVEELVTHNKIIVEENNSSTNDLEKAKNIIMYFATWFKSNPKKFPFFNGQRKESPIRKKSEIEEIHDDDDNHWPERITYYPNDDFFV